MSLDFPSILEHARLLQQATTLGELVDATRVAVEQVSGYRHAWLGLFEEADPEHAVIVAVSGDKEQIVYERCPRVPIAGDAMMAELVAAQRPVVVADARTDPRTNKEIVARLGNRTIVNVPLLLGGASIGSLGTGTYDDEGVRPPTETQLDALVVFAAQLAAAIERVRMQERHRAVEREREREQLQRRLETVQRVESVALLASGVAHDFNNYLQVVFSALESVRDAPLSPLQRSLVNSASEAAEHACALARQLLTMGRRAAAPKPLDLGAHVRDTVELLRRSIPSGIEVTTETAPTPAIEADPAQLDQVLTNLVLNARDAMGDQGRLRLAVDEVRIDAETAAREPWARPGRFVRVRVEDTGPGMSQELLQQVFEPFFTTKRTGTGMGLAIVSRVVAKHGGLLHCASRPGEGTTFHVLFPVREARAA
jgi:signal transduction histidine kinase